MSECPVVDSHKWSLFTARRQAHFSRDLPVHLEQSIFEMILAAWKTAPATFSSLLCGDDTWLPARQRRRDIVATSMTSGGDFAEERFC